VRRARAADYPAFVRLFPELQVDDPVPSAAQWEAAIAPWTWLIEPEPVGGAAGVDGPDSVVGYCYCQEYEDTGYVRHVVVAPEARRAGVGRALMRFVAAELRGTGRRRWCLNVKPHNEPALRLYESLGLAVRHEAAVVRMPWALLEDGLGPAGSAQSTPRPAPSVVLRALAPARFSVAEACFGLPRGQLDAAARQGRVLFEAVAEAAQDDAPVGLAALDPGFPGAFPFRLRSGQSALAPMLHALRARALPAHDHVQLVFELTCEDERVAVARILEGGGTLRDRVLHLEGRL
jgi:ribosomal protein S18 acetylase RimI-like enzyme